MNIPRNVLLSWLKMGKQISETVCSSPFQSHAYLPPNFNITSLLQWTMIALVVSTQSACVNDIR